MKLQVSIMLLLCSSRNRCVTSFGVSNQKFNVLSKGVHRIRPLFWGEDDDDNFSMNKSGMSTVSDGKGRKFRGGRSNDFNESNGGGWDDFDDFESRQKTDAPRNRKPKSNPRKTSSRNFSRNQSDPRKDRSSSFRFERFRPENNRGGMNRNERTQGRGNSDDTDRINLRALDAAGFQHLYGLAPIINALSVNRRDWPMGEEEGASDFLSVSNDDVKPTARLQSGLFVQEGKKQQQGSGKAETGQQIINLAKDR